VIATTASIILIVKTDRRRLIVLTVYLQLSITL